MKKTKSILLFLVLFTYTASSQVYVPDSFNNVIKTLRADDVVCPGIEGEEFVHYPSPVDIAQARIRQGQDAPQRSEFIVTYNGFPEKAKQAFQKAVDIWEHLIYSDVPIRVTANWVDLDRSILGSAGTSQWVKDFDAARYVDTYYPIALAEKLAGKPLNSDKEEDIYCSFNKNVNWHFDEPEAISGSKYDFTTVVLHELAHGLGFFSSFHAEDELGTYGDGKSTFKTIFDVYVESHAGNKLLDPNSFSNNSIALYRALVGDNVFYKQSKSGHRPKLYAPDPFASGSSISHLDMDTYMGTGENLLMVPFISTKAVVHDPGKVALDMMYEMGWRGTSIYHEAMKNRLYIPDEPVVFKIKVVSDHSVLEESVLLEYETILGRKTVQMTNIPGTNEYTASVLFPEEVDLVLYKFEVSDDMGNTVYFPGTDGIAPDQYVYGFEIGKDVTPPILAHFAPEVIDQSSIFLLSVLAEDDFDETLTIDMVYHINDGPEQSISLEKFDSSLHHPDFSQGQADEITYVMSKAVTGLKAGDLISYNFVARDLSGNINVLPQEYISTNKDAQPVPSYYETVVTSVLNPVASYSNDFERNNNDFALLGFKIGTESGMQGSALHSSHPYRNGLGLVYPGTNQTVVDFEKNEIAMLRKPVVLGAGASSSISFDEIVLVESGSPDMYDYVIVEGNLPTLNSGWFPLEDGYDSGAHSAWSALFDSDMSSGDYPNSNAKPSQVYYKKRIIDLDEAGLNRFAGYPMLIRFRLYSDQLVNGWGWVIDNLNIQEETPIILSNRPEVVSSIMLYPNPVSDQMEIKANISGEVSMQIYGITGGLVLDKIVEKEGPEFRHQLNLSALPAGIYVLKLDGKDNLLYKRFVKL